MIGPRKLRQRQRQALPVMERSDFPRLQTIATGMDERDLWLLLVVAAYEGRECPKDSPTQIANSLVALLRPKRELRLLSLPDGDPETPPTSAVEGRP